MDGDRVFVQSMSGYAAALDAASGKMLWGQDLIKEIGAPAPNYGFSSSPLVLGNRVVCAGGVALDKRTGRVVWKARGVAAYYPSPLPLTSGGRPGVLFVGENNFLCVAADDGKTLWELPHGNGNFFMGPVVAGNRVLF